MSASRPEGRIALKEFSQPRQGQPDQKLGDIVEVYLERIENAARRSSASREKARREEAWTRLEKSSPPMNRRRRALRPREGRLHRRPRRRRGVLARQPSRYSSVLRCRPADEVAQPFQILKMDRHRGNIVVSRRAVLEETRAEQRVGQNLKEGQVVEGVVKNITDYGASWTSAASTACCMSPT